MEKIQVGIIGASGYAGAELVRLLWTHPMVNICGISSKSYLGQSFSDLYPSFYSIINLTFEDEDIIIHKSDLVFASLPHGLSETIAKKCSSQHKKFIDLGADFRLDEEADYQAWYHLDYHELDLHKKAVYGLPELYRDEIKEAEIIGNPGCYPTSIALALAPLLKCNIIDMQHVIIDAKSGATGAGKGLSDTTHYPHLNGSFAPYKIGAHRHTPEIEQTLSKLANQNVQVSFTPHLLPVNRGIISTIYVDLKHKKEFQEIYQLYLDFYKQEPFVRIVPQGSFADLKYIKYSNYCDISLHMDERNQRLILVSTIDNMVKGAAGQAIQNMNIMYQLQEDMGLTMIPASF